MCVYTNVCWNKQIVMVGLTCTPLQHSGSHNFHLTYTYIYIYMQYNYIASIGKHNSFTTKRIFNLLFQLLTF